MASSPSPFSSNFDEAVPADDVIASTGKASGARMPASAQAALEVAGRAAWLAWQIGALEVKVSEAEYQLSGIADDLARFADRFPEDLHAQAIAAFEAAKVAAKAGNLEGIAEAARQIRVSMEQYHHAMLV